MSFTTNEMCPFCMSEHEITEIVQPCPTCKNPLVACSVCKSMLPNKESFCNGCKEGSKFEFATDDDFLEDEKIHHFLFSSETEEELKREFEGE